ncbi:Cytokinin riboside 5'-monophosphate phosphoribohydrolase [Nymphaea thermarum]|nr:Cytokinin riboside 5'-monophosphate phosphoribohydrolase [Nymphaea thermarum]
MESNGECKPSRFNRVCVFCGSSSGRRNCYQDAAIELGRELVSRNVNLVYGGGNVGLMGLVSQEVYNGGRHVLGYPINVVVSSVAFCFNCSGHSDVFSVQDYSQDFDVQGGGYGTLEELLEVITWAQLGIHNKPVGLLNVDGYYNSFLSFIDKAVDDGFVTPSQRNIIVSAPNAKELVQMLEVGDETAKRRIEIRRTKGLSSEVGLARVEIRRTRGLSSEVGRDAIVVFRAGSMLGHGVPHS